MPQGNEDIGDYCEKLKRKRSIPIWILAIVISGVVRNKLYTFRGRGKDGQTHVFYKPLFVTWSTFLGMSLSLIIFFAWRRYQTNIGNRVPDVQKKLYIIPIITGICSVMIAYIWRVSMSILGSAWTQVLIAFIVVFAGVFRVFYRKRKLLFYQYIGLSIVIGGTIVFGFFEMIDTSKAAESSSHTVFNTSESMSPFPILTASRSGMVFLGLILSIAGQFIWALQVNVEEKLLWDDNMPVSLLLGMEGVYGLIFCTIVLFPIASAVPSNTGYGIYEDIPDAFYMTFHNAGIFFLLLLYVILSVVFTTFSLFVIQFTEAFVRILITPVTSYAFSYLINLFFLPMSKNSAVVLVIKILLCAAALATMIVGILIVYRQIKTKCLRNEEQSDPIGRIQTNSSQPDINTPILSQNERNSDNV